MEQMPTLFALACLTFLPALTVADSFGEEASRSGPPSAVEATRQAPAAAPKQPSAEKAPQWKLVIGGTYAWPKLTKANHDIHAVETELRQTAPGIKRFEDWDDRDKGTFSAGLHRRIEWKGLVFWPNVTVAYGKGGVYTSEQNVNTVLAVPMNYRFRQDYTFWLGELGWFVEAFRTKRLSVLAGGYLMYGILQSDSLMQLQIPLAGVTRYGNGKFREGVFGASAEVVIVYDLPFWERLSLHLAGRYDWLRFAGPTKVSQTQTTPLGTTAIAYDRRTVSDITGPGIFFAVAYGF